MQVEKTVVIIKPNVSEENRNEIFFRLEQAGLNPSFNMLNIFAKEKFEAHYEEHSKKDFFPSLIEYMTSGRCHVMLWTGERAVEKGREVLQKIRADMKDPNAPARENLMHASDSLESARKEFHIWFDWENYKKELEVEDNGGF